MDLIEYFESYPKALIILLVLVFAIVLTRMSSWLYNKSFATASAKLKVDPTRYTFFKHTTSFIIWVIAAGTIVALIPALKALSITLFASAGIFVAILGFAAQEAFSNIINGVFIIMFKPFRVGDIIKVGPDHEGIVKDLTLRHTVINNFENKSIIIPNSLIASETIVNYSIGDKNICRWIEVGISYDSDVDLATKIIQEIAVAHPKCIDVRTQKEKKNGEPKVKVYLNSFGDFSIDLRAFVWTSDPYHARQMHSDINKAIKKRFEAEGVEIPFPYRTLVYKKDLAANAYTKTVK